MKSVSNYMGNKHTTLVNNYCTPDGVNSESCGLIALTIARLMLAEGRMPYIAAIKGEEALVPKLFDGRVTWGSHQVCCADGMAYDPMLGVEPVPINDYCERAFQGEVSMSVLISQDRIKEFAAENLSR